MTWAASARAGDLLLVGYDDEIPVAEYHIVGDSLVDDAGGVVGTRTAGQWSIGATAVPAGLERGRSGPFVLDSVEVELVFRDELETRWAWGRLNALVGLGVGLQVWWFFMSEVRKRTLTM